MEVKASLNNLQIAPRKVRLLADLIRGLSVDKAKQQLMVSQKQAAKPLMKLVNSAAANAANNFSMEKSTLRIKSITVGQGRTLKRWAPKAFGRATMVRKRASHIDVVLEGEAGKASAKPSAKAKKAEVEPKEDKQDMEKKAPEKKASRPVAGNHKPMPVDPRGQGHERPTQHMKDKKGLVKK